ncbi:NfeD family protein [Chloroflexota bacterium]
MRGITGRLILAIISTTLEEIALAIIVIWGLPQLGTHIPLWGLVIMMIGWAAYSIFIFRLGTRALKREVVIGLPTMIGCRGEVVSPLIPEGLVRIHGELWVAKSAGDELEKGGEVVVVGQDRLKLLVKNRGTDTSEDPHKRSD